MMQIETAVPFTWDPTNLEINDVKEKNFSYLLVRDLLTIACVSRNWNVLSEKKIFWIRTYCNFWPIYFYGKNTCRWEQAGRSGLNLEKINVKQLKTLLFFQKTHAIEAVQYLTEKVNLTEKVKIHAYSDVAPADLVFSNESEPYVLGNRVKITEELKVGFIANMKLYRAGLSTKENVMQFASVLKNDYGCSKGWSDLAIELLSENKIEEAKEILKEQLEGATDEKSLVTQYIPLSA